jgi:hypothetical protein
LLGNGDGTLQAGQISSYGGFFGFGTSTAEGDFNGDGIPDLAVTHPCLSSIFGACGQGLVSVMLGIGNGTFQPPEEYSSGGLPGFGQGVAVGDFNGDGKLDLAATNYLAADGCNPLGCGASSVGIMQGNGDGTFLAPPVYSSGGYQPWSVAIGDVNGDGNPDLVVGNLCQSQSNCNNGAIGILLGRGDGTYQATKVYNSGGYYPSSVAVGDFNGDGKLDLAVANDCQSSSNCNGVVAILLGNGDGTFQPAQTFASGGFVASSITVGDVNGDGKLDVLVTSLCSSNSTCDSGGTVGVLLGNGDGTFQPAQTYSTGGYYALSVALADVNGDGKPDLLVADMCQDDSCESSGVAAVLLGNGNGTFQPERSYSVGGFGSEPYSIAVGDFTGDGKVDLALADNCSQAVYDCEPGVSVLLGNGDGSFQAEFYSYSGVFSSVAVADLNGDKKQDIVVTGIDCATDGVCTYGHISVLLGNGDGTFQTASTYLPAGQALAVGDLNLDGRPDVAVVGDGVTVLLNAVGGLKESTTTTIESSTNPSDYGQSVTFTATVSAGFGTPRGTVSFYDGANFLGNGMLSNGKAVYSTSSLPVGSDSITATYNGDSSFGGSTSSPLNQIVIGTRIRY